jgi:hypothetical protein
MSINKSILDLTRKASKKWTKQRKAEERERRAIQNRRARMTCARITIKEVAYRYMKRAYMEASANGTLPASARQIMYKARPTIQAHTGQQLKDAYFTQTLLPDYINEHGVDWDVVFDDRGHFHEPHTGHSIGLGTLAVRAYLSGMHGPELSELTIEHPTVATQGPEGRFGAVLFVEKEGFMPLFQSVSLAERYDIAIMSTKGMSVTASRSLVDNVCGEFGVPLLVLHDFDKAGFSILGKLQHSNRRYQYSNHAKVIDLGLRLEDVSDLGLQEYAEDSFDSGNEHQRRINMRANGATRDEIEFLLNRRVELNAMSSDILVEWIERKLIQHSITKIVPPPKELADLYRLAIKARILKDSLSEAQQKAEAAADQIEIPNDLHDRVNAVLRNDSKTSWDSAVAEIADEVIAGAAP